MKKLEKLGLEKFEGNSMNKYHLNNILGGDGTVETTVASGLSEGWPDEYDGTGRLNKRDSGVRVITPLCFT